MENKSSYKKFNLDSFNKLLEKYNKKRDFYYKFNLPTWRKALRFVQGDENYNKKKRIYDFMTSRMHEVLSVENFSRMARNLKFFQYFLLQDYQIKLLEVCQVDAINDIVPSLRSDEEAVRSMLDDKSKLNCILEQLLIADEM